MQYHGNTGNINLHCKQEAVCPKSFVYTIPTVFVAVTTLAIMFLLDIKIWYYRIDVIVTQVSFDVTLICCFVNIAKQTKKIRMKNIFIKLLLPVFVLTTRDSGTDVFL